MIFIKIDIIIIACNIFFLLKQVLCSVRYRPNTVFTVLLYSAACPEADGHQEAPPGVGSGPIAR